MSKRHNQSKHNSNPGSQKTTNQSKPPIQLNPPHPNPISGSQKTTKQPEPAIQSTTPYPSPDRSHVVQPEQMSLSAHSHIQKYLKSSKKNALDKEDLTAVLRLYQHLRVFGLLSAVGYVNQSNAQEGKVRERTVPVWESLLGQLIDESNPPSRQELMTTVVNMARTESAKYMVSWRRSLILAEHWNFWARAYQQPEQN